MQIKDRQLPTFLVTIRFQIWFAQFGRMRFREARLSPGFPNYGAGVNRGCQKSKKNLTRFGFLA
jgi:hypothetical protein